MSIVNILCLFDQVAETTVPYELSRSVDNIEGLSVTSATLNVMISCDDYVASLILLPSSSLFQRLKALQQLIVEGRYAIIHTHHVRTALMVWLLCKFTSLRKKHPTLIWFHTVHNDFSCFSKLQQIIFKLVVKEADNVICNSNNTLSSLSRFNVQREHDKFTMIYNGVNISRVKRWLHHEGHNTTSNVFLNVNRLVPQKNVETLIRAFHIVRDKYPDCKLIICGDGPLRHKLEKLSNDLGISLSVEFKGLLGREEVYRIMCNEEILVTPSLWEGFCNVNIEAMAAGMALLVSKIDPLPEILGEAAVYFFPTDIDALARQMIALMTDSDRRAALQVLACERAERFSIEKAAHNYAKAYLSAVGDNNMVKI